MKKLITKIVLILSTVWIFYSVFADKLEINSSLPSWEYNKVIKVELIPSDINVKKIFYSFNPNSTPNDLLLYTWAIIIKKSTPIIYWWYIDTSNESKIKQNDYIINYPNEIRLWTWIIFEENTLKNLYITNIGTWAIDISYREVRNDSWKIIIPENTSLDSWKTYEIRWLNGSSIISLYAPNEEKKDFLEPKIIIETKNETKISWPKVEAWSVSKYILDAQKEDKINSNTNNEQENNIQTETINNTENNLSNNIDNETKNNEIPSDEKQVNSPEIKVDNKENNQETNISDNIKSSTQESWNNSWFWIAIIIWIIWIWIWTKFFLKKV